MTRRIEEFMGLEKEYTGKFILGKTTPSHDLETKISEGNDISTITDKQIQEATIAFTGTIQQIPPMHSAIKIGGKRAYEFARQGQRIELKQREVEIRIFEISRIQLPEISFRIVCSRGTYIRSIARDFGDALGVGAYLSELCRTRIGTYTLENALAIDDVTS